MNKYIKYLAVLLNLFVACIYYNKADLKMATDEENEKGTQYSIQKLNENISKARIEKFSSEKDSSAIKKENIKFQNEKSKSQIELDKSKEATDARKNVQSHCCTDQ